MTCIEPEDPVVLVVQLLVNLVGTVVVVKWCWRFTRAAWALRQEG